MESQWQVHLLEAADQEFHRDMLYEALWDAPDEPRRPRTVLDDPGIRRIFENWGRTEDLGLVASDPASGERIGAIWARLDGFDQIEGFGCDYPFLGLAVIEPYRRKGVGTFLMKRFIAAARPRTSGLRLGVNPRNGAAIALYERLGFTEYAIGKGGYPQMKLPFVGAN